MTWPGIGIIRCRFTQIVEARPYKLSDGPVIVIGQGKINIRHIAPPTELRIITRGLVVGIHGTSLYL